ncbi:MAG TPA: regulatory protein RecX [Chthonomonadaceae bacterium]|nr:regulatory protein RecX [Chthonomonadaceae bacterium]
MKQSDIEAARAVAFRYLGYSARSAAEIRSRLARNEFADEMISQVVEELRTAGYLDDAEFARHWVQDRADRKRYGRTRLAAELNRKGVDRDAADEALGAIGADDEARRAMEAAGPRWARIDPASLDAAGLQKEKARIAAFLTRRGFGWDTIKKVLAALVENSG